MATAEALPFIQRTPEWIEARETLGVGASQAAAALGLSRWESPFSLWSQKLQLVPPREPSLAMLIGTATEDVNTSLFEAETGFKARRARRLLRSKAHPFLLASLDRDLATQDAVLETKWTERGDGYGEPGTDQVPDEVLCQVVQQMAVTGRGRAYVSVLFGGRRHGIYVVDRDPVAEAAVIEGVGAFWDHVVSRTEPPMDGSESTLRALAEVYPRDSGEELEADEQLRGLLADLRLQTGARDDAESAIAELKAQIQGAMGPASALVAPGIGRVTWKATKGRAEIDWRGMAEQWLPGPRQIAEFTTTKPGSRRFLPRWEEETNV